MKKNRSRSKFIIIFVFSGFFSSAYAFKKIPLEDGCMAWGRDDGEMIYRDTYNQKRLLVRVPCGSGVNQKTKPGFTTKESGNSIISNEAGTIRTFSWDGENHWHKHEGLLPSRGQ